jgi:RNA-binding protein
MKKISNQQIRYLNGLAHNLKAVVMIGDKGLTPPVIDSIKSALKTHELIKINIRSNNNDEFLKIVAQILKKTTAYKIRVIGKKLIIYLANNEPKITLPQ